MCQWRAYLDSFGRCPLNLSLFECYLGTSSVPGPFSMFDSWDQIEISIKLKNGYYKIGIFLKRSLLSSPSCMWVSTLTWFMSIWRWPLKLYKFSLVEVTCCAGFKYSFKKNRLKGDVNSIDDNVQKLRGVVNPIGSLLCACTLLPIK